MDISISVSAAVAAHLDKVCEEIRHGAGMSPDRDNLVRSVVDSLGNLQKLNDVRMSELFIGYFAARGRSFLPGSGGANVADSAKSFSVPVGLKTEDEHESCESLFAAVAKRGGGAEGVTLSVLVSSFVDAELLKLSTVSVSTLLIERLKLLCAGTGKRRGSRGPGTRTYKRRASAGSADTGTPPPPAVGSESGEPGDVASNADAGAATEPPPAGNAGKSKKGRNA